MMNYHNTMCFYTKVLIVAGLSFIIGAAAFNNDTTSLLRKILCPQNYSLGCLKLDLIQLLERLGNSQLQILPGLVLDNQITFTSNDSFREDLLKTLDSTNDTRSIQLVVEDFLSNRVQECLSALTFSIRILDPTTIKSAERLSESILTSLVPLQTGRKKGYFASAVWAAGAMATVGLATMAALSGKALASSMLALMLAGVSVMRHGHRYGGSHDSGGGCKSSHFDNHGRSFKSFSKTPDRRLEYFETTSLT